MRGHFDIDDDTYYIVTIDRYENITSILQQCSGWDEAQSIIDSGNRSDLVIADQPHVDLYLDPEE